MDPRQRRMRRQGNPMGQARGRGPMAQQTRGPMPNEAQPMLPPGGLAAPPPGTPGPPMTKPMGLPPMNNTGITGGMAPHGPMGGPPGAPTPMPTLPVGTPGPPQMMVEPMNREAARNARMNQGWQQQLSQQGGMGYGGPGAMQPAMSSPEPMMKPAIQSLMRSG